MATLTGNQVKDTYRSLLKLEDNGSLSANLKIVQDGIGNSTPLSLSTTAVVSSVSIEAPGFKTPGGTSAQYLRADGSVGAPASLSSTDDLTEGSTNLYDKTVVITDGIGINSSGTYPNFSLEVSGALDQNGLASELKFWSGTQAQYDALTPNADTVYFIV